MCISQRGTSAACDSCFLPHDPSPSSSFSLSAVRFLLSCCPTKCSLLSSGIMAELIIRKIMTSEHSIPPLPAFFSLLVCLYCFSSPKREENRAIRKDGITILALSSLLVLPLPHLHSVLGIQWMCWSKYPSHTDKMHLCTSVWTVQAVTWFAHISFAHTDLCDTMLLALVMGIRIFSWLLVYIY